MKVAQVSNPGADFQIVEREIFGAFCDAHVIPIVGPSPRKGTFRETPDLLSDDTD